MIKLEQRGSVSILKVPGPIAGAEVPEIAELLNDAVSQGCARLVIDCERATLIDSAGVELILDLTDACRAHGGNLILARTSPLVREVFVITRQAKYLKVCDDVTQAIGSFAV